MSKQSESDGGYCGCICECLSLIVFPIVLSFFIDFLGNCSGRGAFESAVKTARNYCNIADSVWNGRE